MSKEIKFVLALCGLLYVAHRAKQRRVVVEIGEITVVDWTP